MLATQNVEVLNEAGATKIVVTCAHCFNTLKNRYPRLGGRAAGTDPVEERCCGEVARHGRAVGA